MVSSFGLEELIKMGVGTTDRYGIEMLVRLGLALYLFFVICAWRCLRRSHERYV